MLRTDSLAFRLGAVAAVWSAVGLILGAFALSDVFRRAAERGFDEQLGDDLESVIGVSELDCDGSLIMPRPLMADRFSNAVSGRYWQVSALDRPGAGGTPQLMQSQSLSAWEEKLELGAPPARGEVGRGNITGAGKRQLRYAERVVAMPAAEAEGRTCIGNRSFRFAVAGDLRAVAAEIDAFDATLLRAIVLLGAALFVLTIVQVRIGLAPLDRVLRSLAAIRQGRANRLEEDFPAEIQPLADELNKLVAHNEEVVKRARTHVGNLAHFLKTPLSVIGNEAQAAQGPLAETVARQVQVMRRQIDHYLARARTAASAAVLGARTEAAPVVGDLVRALSKIYEPQGIRIEKQCREGLSFRGDRADFEEMLGNLIDNAGKWAESVVSVSVREGGPGRLAVSVSDDGPGLSEEQKRRVLERGERLDESKPGSGLGLGIVKEIADLYGGSLSLGRSPSGGLAAELDLPAAERGS